MSDCIYRNGRSSARMVKAVWWVALGPGNPLPAPDEFDEEPWKRRGPQAKEGDYVIFLRKAAVEIRYAEKTYLAVPQAAILVLLRDEYDFEDLDSTTDDASDLF